MRGVAGEKLGRLAEKYGIPVSVHAPYNPDVNLGASDKEVRAYTREQMKACLDFASRIKARFITVHGGYLMLKGFSPPEVTDSNQPLYLLVRNQVPLREYDRSEEHTSELQSRPHLVCRLLLEKKKKKIKSICTNTTH